MILWIPGRE